MDLTPKLKAEIDSLTIRELLSRWRFTPSGDPMFQGESGEYWRKRMKDLQDQDPAAYTQASKDIGW